MNSLEKASHLLELYKQKKEEASRIPSVSEELSPLFHKILEALLQVAEKELPQPLIEVAPPEVKVTVDAPVIKNDIQIPQGEAPIVNIDNYDYTEQFKILTDAVNNLRETLENRPKIWEVKRNSNGFIEKVNGA